ncbi:MAG: hypothetical protein ACRCY4_03370 [Brevinema sp.]
MLDKRPNESGIGHALTLSFLFGGNVDSGFGRFGFEANLRYIYSVRRFFSLTTGFDFGVNTYSVRISDLEKERAKSITYGFVFGLVF